MTITEQLIEVGLRENEAKVYIALLGLGQTTVGQIAEKSGLHKQLVYYAAQGLEERQLITTTEVKGRKRFTIMDPVLLKDYAQRRLEQVQILIPKLLELTAKDKVEEKVGIFRDNKGVHQYYLSSIRNQPKGSEVYILGVDSKRYFKIFDQEGIEYKNFEGERVRRNIGLKLLLFGQHNEEMIMNKGRPNVEIKFLKESAQAPMDIMVWENQVGMLFYGPPPYVLNIIGADSVKGFKEYFSVLWEMAKGQKI